MASRRRRQTIARRTLRRKFEAFFRVSRGRYWLLPAVELTDAQCIDTDEYDWN